MLRVLLGPAHAELRKRSAVRLGLHHAFGQRFRVRALFDLVNRLGLCRLLRGRRASGQRDGEQPPCFYPDEPRSNRQRGHDAPSFFVPSWRVKSAPMVVRNAPTAIRLVAKSALKCRRTAIVATVKPPATA